MPLVTSSLLVIINFTLKWPRGKVYDLVERTKRMRSDPAAYASFVLVAKEYYTIRRWTTPSSS